jgi:hypothetical protein
MAENYKIVESPTQFLNTFARGFLNERPIYYLGKKIGYWKGGNLESVCRNATIMLYKGMEIGDPKMWFTKDDLWRDVPVTDFCMRNGIEPRWLTEEDKANLVQKPTGQLVVPGAYGDTSEMPGLSLPLVAGASIAGLGLLLLLLRR